MFSDEDGSATLNIGNSMLTWGAQGVGPPPLQSESGLTLFAVDVYVGHAGARIHLVVG